ncbi:hypothetical protein [Paraburkholderia sp. J41]|uniref:hypothetical protein n=1 Tax=Paraburkholderia sp. J41 TaxID=2805433 RepID=UPI002AC323A5|nr:hypothetical protein [Paraburkholderia sp. J41]
MNRIFPTWAALLAVFVVVTSVYGGYHHFSSIPFGDQWDGEIGFYQKLQDGDYRAFWTQHMEHRIVFSRILFWLDIAVFRGMNVFTVVMNYVLLAAIGLVFWREYRSGVTVSYSAALIAGLIFGYLFLWCQYSNLLWGFQSQVFAVYLFSFLAFGTYSRPQNGTRRLVKCCAFAVVAALSMGNGVVAFFVMVVQGILQRRPWRESALLVLVGLVAAAIYFHHFSRPELPITPEAEHVRLIKVRFFAIFMGNPVYEVSQRLWVCGLLGTVFLVVNLVTVCVLFFKNRITPYRAFLIAVFGMTIISAAGATNSRWVFGLLYAVSSRYTTAMLPGYVATFLLLLDILPTRNARMATAFVSLLLLSYVAPFQLRTFGGTDYRYPPKLALLGQKIGLDHPNYDALIFSSQDHDRFIDKANFAAAAGIGPYGRGWLHDAGVVKFDSKLVDASLCLGLVEASEPDAAGLAVYGWAVPTHDADTSTLIVLVDSSGRTVGYGVTGATRTDIAKSVKGAPTDSGWTGFAKKVDGPLSAYAYTAGKFCPLTKGS